MIADLSSTAPVDWDCERCNTRDTTPAQVTNRYHPCLGLGGLSTPLRRVGAGERTVVMVREDYVGSEDVQYDGDGRPIMAVAVERRDGSNDLNVFAPTAHLAGGD